MLKHVSLFTLFTGALMALAVSSPWIGLAVIRYMKGS